jgi:hypothetical protein
VRPHPQAFILDGQNVIAWGYNTPDASDQQIYFGATTSIILRFGTEAFFFLVLFLGQVGAGVRGVGPGGVRRMGRARCGGARRERHRCLELEVRRLGRHPEEPCGSSWTQGPGVRPDPRSLRLRSTSSRSSSTTRTSPTP